MTYAPTETNAGTGDRIDASLKGACEATIVINKVVRNDDGGTALSGDFVFEIDDAHLSGATLTTMSGGNSVVVNSDATYHIFEDSMS